MKLLLIGSGGREHALAWKLCQSPHVEQLFVAPGNAGTAEFATNLPIADHNIAALCQFAQQQAIDLTVVGPELPLSLGIVDTFQAAGLTIFGPSQAAAQLESSKAFAKAFMQQHNIPTAAYETFTDYEMACDYLDAHPGPVVVKASGLAAGKGVIVCGSTAEAMTALQQIMLHHEFGAAGDEVVIEERLTGREVSLLAFCDGNQAVPLLPARDHKRIFDRDQGPNTGGMGAFAPVPDVDGAWVRQVTEQVLQTAVSGMAAQGTPYVGVLYAGFMLTPTGPKVLEFNGRFGDPETQVLLPLLDGDLVEIMLACIEGKLQPEMVRHKPGACATVVMAAPGYPGNYPKGLPITGVAEAALLENVAVFQAGTKLENGRLLTNGGRVLAVSGWGDRLETAVAAAYRGVATIHFEGAHHRTDIGTAINHL